MVRQYFIEGYYPTGSAVATNTLTPDGALLKAVLLNSGQLLTAGQNAWDKSLSESSMYDNNQGFGRISLINGLTLNNVNTIGNFVVNAQPLTAGQTLKYPFTLTSKCASSLSVTLVWTVRRAK